MQVHRSEGCRILPGWQSRPAGIDLLTMATAMLLRFGTFFKAMHIAKTERETALVRESFCPLLIERWAALSEDGRSFARGPRTDQPGSSGCRSRRSGGAILRAQGAGHGKCAAVCIASARSVRSLGRASWQELSLCPNARIRSSCIKHAAAGSLTVSFLLRLSQCLPTRNN